MSTDREVLVEAFENAMLSVCDCIPDLRRDAEERADALLARGLRLPGAEETMAWGIVRKDGEIIAGGLRNKEAASNFAHEGERVVRVVIRVVEGGDDAS